MIEYKVLKLSKKGGRSRFLHATILATVEASGPDVAVRKVATEPNATYVAVPTSHWQVFRSKTKEIGLTKGR